ncbi:MAG: serine/threonine protein kinase [Planctomycetes bacterium]|nr:serine/threonine protein kinase [Planctomycetota bacterium]
MDNSSKTSSEPGKTPAVAEDLTGQTVAEFHLLRKLGQGGMGAVYLAEQQSPKRKVAVKILRADLAANENALLRFQQEANTVGQLSHANIVQVYAAGEWQGLYYIALEYVEGRNLRDYLAKKGPPTVLHALSIMRQVASALIRASELGIIHRDIKPENILLTRKGEVKVADFGLCRLPEGDPRALSKTDSNLTMGTPLYMSPEQVEGKPLDARTDIYSFGVTCYHMFSGEPPFRGNTAFEVALQHVRDEPVPLTKVRPDLPLELCAVIHKMMVKDPAQRYQTCRDLLKDIVRVRDTLNGVTGHLPLSTTGLVAEPASSTKALTVAPRRRLLVALVLTLLAAGVAGAGLGLWHQKGRSPADGEEALAEPAPFPEATPPLKREQTRKRWFDEFFAQHNGRENRTLGVQLCLDVALPCLEHGRLEEADEVFARLEKIKQDVTYHALGTLGRAIVLALRERPDESNALFNKLQWRPGNGGDRAARAVQALIVSNRALSKWLAEAVHHNLTNGLNKKDLPLFLQRYVRLDGR